MHIAIVYKILNIKMYALDLADNLLPSVALISAWTCYRMFSSETLEQDMKWLMCPDAKELFPQLSLAAATYSTHCPSSDCRCGEATFSL